MNLCIHSDFFFFFNDTATTEIYTLSLHDALPISRTESRPRTDVATLHPRRGEGDEPHRRDLTGNGQASRSEEHTSELQSRQYLVCRLLLEKKNKKTFYESGRDQRLEGTV